MASAFVKHWGTWNEKTMMENLKKENIKIVEYERKRIAFYDLKCEKYYAYIHSIQISRAFQRKGLGSFLIGLIENETRENKLDKIRLKVFKDNFAMKLYLKLGYKPIKEDESSVILQKELKS